MQGNHKGIEKRLWIAAEELRADSKLMASEYSLPVLGLIFIKYADFKFRQAVQELKGKGCDWRPIDKLHYQGKGVLYLLERVRLSNLIRQDMATPSNYFFYFNLLQGREQGKSRSSGAAITAVTGIFITRGNFSSDGVQAF
ncbi:MAG: type I restriction-modification system subunit M N-terminal domain-containing protein [Methanothrix sp.]|uniref:type I restriction-modification system subunit M N-terminal domain-containing protein n=1 Tax=Methanothrix sp. TaxID=90426 RepID=UPI0025D20278|nr:type I restriction-modification system subunit M N-terminal domain-containing protein [Methanothrix sp.]MCK9406769.1 type I restriction-modification system subunit M N-terminal domain-containing protein [Methanothrix sp.]